MKSVITVHLTLDHSEELRELLKENGFAIYYQNWFVQNITPIERQQIRFSSNSKNDEFICYASGDIPFGNDQINLSTLENHPACKRVEYESFKEK